jgi:RNA polymerase sigma-70 factor, ECF subfamily
MPAGEDSWREWFDRHGAALVMFARRWVTSRADAEDVVQEAFVRFWRSHSRVDDPAAYLFRSVKHAALDWMRSQGRRQHREREAALPETEPLLTAPLEEAERREAIEASLAQLPPEQAEVLVLRIWGGLSFPQIAAALEISENTAASRYRYALSRLRDVLAKEPIV